MSKLQSKPKKRDEDMTELITSIFAPCVTKREFDKDYKGFLYLTNREALTVLSSVIKHAGSG